MPTMPRKRTKSWAPSRYTGDSGPPSWQGFQDTPVAEVVRQRPRNQSRVPLAELAVARPFALSQEDFLDRLAQARAIASEIVTRCGGQPQELSGPEMLGALVLGNHSIRNIYGRSDVLRARSSKEVL